LWIPIIAVFSESADQEGKFFLKLKNSKNFETRDIPIEGKGKRGTFQKFEFDPSSHDQISDILSKDGKFLVMNISIATDFTRYKWIGKAQVELRDLKIEMK